VGTDLFSAELSPRLRLMLLANAHRFAAIVQVAAELGVADRLAGGSLPVLELAAACGAHEQALGRILRSGALLARGSGLT
jgi:hypothetical protein